MSLSRIWRSLTGQRAESPILSKAATVYSGPARWCSRLVLYEDELMLSGWGWTGPTKERIALSEVTSVEKWTTQAGPNFRIHVDGRGRPLEVRVTGAFFWQQAFQERNIPVHLRH